MAVQVCSPASENGAVNSGQTNVPGLPSSDIITGTGESEARPSGPERDTILNPVEDATVEPQKDPSANDTQGESTARPSNHQGQALNAELAPDENGDASQDPKKSNHNGSEELGDNQKDDQNQDAPNADGNDDAPKEDEDPENPVRKIKKKVTERKQKFNDKAHPPGGFDDTPLPKFPSGYTIKFIFHKAWNLPIADIHNGVADPFIEATLTASVPSRHKEDPPLRHRTKTIRATTEPEWEEEWIVANVPATGFSLKCRFYDEDYPDHNDRLGNLTFTSPRIDEDWKGIQRQQFELKKRVGSKRAYFFKVMSTPLRKDHSITPGFEMSIELVGKSEGRGSQVYTVGPTRYIQHFSPMIGRMTGIKVHEDSKDDEGLSLNEDDTKSKKYDFQATEIQLEGPVPPKLYHRYVEFRPMIGRMFDSSGLRGRLLHKALTKQHNRIYNYDSSTEYGSFKACSEEASLQFLKLAHFDEGGRIFTYVLTLDGLWRFTETGKEFGIDLLSKHTMHSNVATYIACSGEFFIRRLEKPTATSDPEPDQPTHPNDSVPNGPPHDGPPGDPSFYQLVIDNDSGTYRPDKSVLPDLKKFLERNLPGLGIVTMDCGDDELEELKKKQNEAKNKEGKRLNMVLNRSPSSSSFSSDDESRLGDLEQGGDATSGTWSKSKKERAWDALEDPDMLKQTIKEKVPLAGSSSTGKE